MQVGVITAKWLILINNLSNSMEQITSWEANW
jgi:hypothetical protein